MTQHDIEPVDTDAVVEEVEESTLPNPNIWQRFVAVVAGVATFAIAMAAYMILVDSRIPSPFGWVGFFFVGLAGAGFALARATVLERLGTNQENLEMAKPLRWLTTAAVGVSSLIAFYMLTGFLIVLTPVGGLMGDNGFATVVSSPAGNGVEVTPMGNVGTDESTREMLDLVASGEVYNAPEDRKVAAIAANWEQAFGVAATAADIEYVKSIAELIERDALAGKSCSYFDDAFDYLAQDFNNDRGRTEYVFSAGVIAWATPDAAVRVITCLG